MATKQQLQDQLFEALADSDALRVELGHVRRERDDLESERDTLANVVEQTESVLTKLHDHIEGQDKRITRQRRELRQLNRAVRLRDLTLADTRARYGTLRRNQKQIIQQYAEQLAASRINAAKWQAECTGDKAVGDRIIIRKRRWWQV